MISKDELTKLLTGKFIVVEGLEGAGKSTAVENLRKWLVDSTDLNVVIVREPGGTPISEEIRNIIKTDRKNDGLSSKSELFLIYAARVQLVEKVIKPSLDRGDVVIADRFELSTYAYQGGGRGVPFANIKSCSDMALGGFSPDYCFYLDIDPIKGLDRVRERGELDRIEKEDIAFFKRVRRFYYEYIKHGGHKYFQIDASKSPEEILKIVKESLVEPTHDKVLETFSEILKHHYHVPKNKTRIMAETIDYIVKSVSSTSSFEITIDEEDGTKCRRVFCV
jgi:dTMP kinase